jgi:hypothetical protein
MGSVFKRGHFVIFSSLTIKSFGDKNGASIYARMSLSPVFGSFAQSIIIS